MTGLRGVLAGSLALIALHTLVAYRGPSRRLAELAGPQGLAVRLVERFLDPTVPGIPDRSAGPTATPRTPSGPVPGDRRTDPVPRYPAPAPRQGAPA